MIGNNLIRKLQSLATTLAILATSLVFVSVQAPSASAAGSGDDKFFDHAATELISSSSQVIPASASSTFTVEAWVRPDTLSIGHSAIVSQSQNPTTSRFYMGLVDGGKIHVGIGDPNFTTPDAYFTAGVWNHIAVSVGTGSTNNIKVYVDGKLVHTGSLARIATAADFAIGSDENGALDFDGGIDQVKVWGSELTQSQINLSRGVWQDAGLESAGLISHYDFNAGSASALVDNKGSNDLTMASATSANIASIVQRTNAAGKSTFVFNRYLTQDGLWSVPTGLSPTAEALVVGAGGGGGAAYDNVAAGGGGAGQVKTSNLTPGTSLEIKVGVGGSGGLGNRTISPFETSGVPGTSSKIGAFEALGGLGGQASRTAIPSNGAGGTSGVSAAATGGAGRGGGGGGGASGNGANSASGGTGGAGVSSSLSGSAVTYGVGGNGGVYGSTTDGSNGTTPGQGGAGAASLSSADADGGRGADGLVILVFGNLPVHLDPVTGGATQSTTLSGYVSSSITSGTLVLSSKNGTLDISAASLTTSGATKVAAYSGSGTSYLSLHGTSSELHAALNLVEITLAGPLTTAGSVKAEIYEDISLAANQFFNPSNGHIYQYVSTSSSFSAAETAAESATISTNAGALSGYLATITSTTERDWQRANMTAIGVSGAAVTNLYIGGKETSDGNYSWVGGPEAGPFSTGLYVASTSSPSGVDGSFISWDLTEPNNNGGAGVSNCAVTNFDLDGNSGGGYWDDIICSDAANGYIIEYGGITTDDNVSVANVTVTKPVVYVDFSELDFDFSRATQVTNGSSNNGVGKDQGDKVLFADVTNRNGIAVDAVVTTTTLSSAVITAYDSGTGAGGEESYFEVDIKISANNGYGLFTFDFYLADTYGTAGETGVILQNVNVSAIDIDYYQFNDFSQIDGYTLSSPTYLTVSGRSNPTGFPTDIRFQGRSGYSTNDPRDMAIATYGEIESFTVKLGTTKSSSNANLYGVAFKALSFGNYGTATVGEEFTLTYSGNSNTSGSAPSSATGGVGANISVASNSGSLVRAGYSFGGWNTKADGTGTTYSVGSTYSMPQNGGTLYALWVPAQYRLTYDANGGESAPTSQLRNAGSVSALSSTAAVRSGYTFDGWNTQDDGNGTSYAAAASFTMPSQDTTLYAQWTQLTGTLAYNANNGTTTQASTTGNVSATVSVATGANTNRSGYTFAGWNTQAAGGGTDYAAGTTFTYVNATTTLYAQWTPVLYSVTYSANGGTGSVSGLNNAKVGDLITVAAGTGLSRTGYTFQRWDTQANGSGTSRVSASTFTMPAANVALYAVWEVSDYSLIYNANGGAIAPDAVLVPFNTTQTLSSGGLMTPPDGKRLVGWNTQADGEGTSYVLGGSLTMPASTVTLYAQWVPSNVKITYNGNGGSGVPAESTSPLNQSYSIDSGVPLRTGYEFTGWQISGGDGTNYISSGTTSFTPTADTVLVAQWQAVSYSLTYNGNGTTISIAAQSHAYQASASVTATVPTRSGFEFLGWNDLQDGSGIGQPTSSSFSMPASNVVLYAQWQANPHTLTYDGNGGSGSPASQVRAFDSTSNLSPTEPSRTGYTFTGWNTEIDGSGDGYQPSDALTMPDSNVTLYAQWEVRSFTLAFDANDGTGAPAQQIQDFGANVTLPATLPTYVGFTFTGWNTAANGSGTSYAASGSLIMPAANLTLFAQWSTTSYSLTYDANGGAGAPVGEPTAYGATVTVSSSVPTRTGYTFDSWNTNNLGTGTRRVAADTFSMPASDVTLYAVWVASPVTVRFNVNGGTGSFSAIPTLANTSVDVPSSTPTKPGYTFTGWNTQLDGSGTPYDPEDAATPDASDLTLYAQWTPISYSISYDANGGTGTVAASTGILNSSQTIASGSSLSKNSFRFIGWNTNESGTGTTYLEGASKLMPLGGLTLFAVWISSDIEIAYNDNGGSGGPGSDNATFGTSYQVSTDNPTRLGYNFTGWKIDNAGTLYGGSAGAASFTPTTDVLLVAQWTPNDYTLSYNANTGTGTTPADETLNYQAITSLPDPLLTVANSTFLGWNTEQDGSGFMYSAFDDFMMPAEDVTLYAQWSAIYFVIDFNPGDGSGEPADQFAPAGTTVVIPTTEPTLTGFDFAGWEKPAASAPLAAGSTFTMPPSNLILVATWTAQSAGISTPSTQIPVITSPTDPEDGQIEDGDSEAETDPKVDAANGGSLADTGFSSGNLGIFGGVMVAIGAMLTATGRRRKS